MYCFEDCNEHFGSTESEEFLYQGTEYRTLWNCIKIDRLERRLGLVEIRVSFNDEEGASEYSLFRT
jgi:hypothetical protein